MRGRPLYVSALILLLRPSGSLVYKYLLHPGATLGHDAPMAQTLAKKLEAWRQGRTNPECAALLGIPLATYRKYLYGNRTPNKLAMVELEKRMAGSAEVSDDGKKTKANGKTDGEVK